MPFKSTISATIFTIVVISVSHSGETDPKPLPQTKPTDTTAAPEDYTPELKPLKVNGEVVAPTEVKKIYNNLLRAFKAPGKPLSKALLDKLASRARENAIQRVATRQYIEQHKLVITPEQLMDDYERKKAELTSQGSPIEKILKLLDMKEPEFVEEYRPIFALTRSVESELNPDELKAAFEKERPKLALRRGSQILLSHEKAKFSAHPERSLDDTKKLAISVVERLKRGEDFAALAKDVSDDKHSKEQGGDVGFLKPADTPKQLTDTLYVLQKIGDVSDPVESDLGIHIVKLTEQRSEEEAFKHLVHQIATQRTSELINKLAKAAKVE